MAEEKKCTDLSTEEFHFIGYQLFLVMLIRGKICLGDMNRAIGNESKNLGIPAEKLVRFAELALPDAVRLSLHCKWPEKRP